MTTLSRPFNIPGDFHMFKTNRRNRASRNRISKTVGWVPVVNGLEERVLLASYVVMNTKLSGTGSLAEAIGLANASPGEDVISFDTSYFSVDQVIDYAPSIEYLPAISDTSGGKLRIQGPTSSKLTIRFNDCAEIYTKSPCEISDLYLEARTTGDLSNDYLYR